MANKWRDQFKKLFVNYSELPADVVMDLPRITLIGQLHIYIENHKGVLAFSKTELRLALSQGQLLITGNQFVLKTILPEEILLEGTIDKVQFID
ncbi:sporulation protein YqfC [Pullulanibacillus sp. KACC 23026]|uniref:sporulation protein YqfC n=1 Tax=Pullulanibacillus sp. KACC 23026 TaxID=3028315 RepID=UPI0023AEC0D7|nr:sporulation protein YqfC [Pullulanibacillus sp. KACC 23026]WEG14233.1 sporulation protein YqfC [Pullulanibacillus sp. KACC 23026]